MSKRIVSLLLACAVIAVPSYAEEVYKRIDEDGVPSFSDTKSKDAEKIIVEPVNVQKIPALTEQPPIYNAPAVSTQKYSKLAISSPADQSTLRNEHKITLIAAISPGLSNDHKIEFLDNGQPLQAASKSTRIELTDFPRGSHNLSVRVLDKNGKVLQTSSSVTVHIFRAVIKPPPPPPKKSD